MHNECMIGSCHKGPEKMKNSHFLGQLEEGILGKGAIFLGSEGGRMFLRLVFGREEGCGCAKTLRHQMAFGGSAHCGSGAACTAVRGGDRLRAVAGRRGWGLANEYCFDGIK